MLRSGNTKFSLGKAVTAGLVALPMLAMGAVAASAQELVITIKSVRAVDRIDPAGLPPDFYARVTVDGKEYKTPVIRKTQAINPNWVIRAPISGREAHVKLELYDKDVARDDPIDINRLDGKRDLDFTVRTRPCRVLGFAATYDCAGRGATISRAGGEKKSADITFTVDTRRR